MDLAVTVRSMYVTRASIVKGRAERTDERGRKEGRKEGEATYPTEWGRRPTSLVVSQLIEQLASQVSLVACQIDCASLM